MENYENEEIRRATTVELRARLKPKRGSDPKVAELIRRELKNRQERIRRTTKGSPANGPEPFAKCERCGKLEADLTTTAGEKVCAGCATPAEIANGSAA